MKHFLPKQISEFEYRYKFVVLYKAFLRKVVDIKDQPLYFSDQSFGWLVDTTVAYLFKSEYFCEDIVVAEGLVPSSQDGQHFSLGRHQQLQSQSNMEKTLTDFRGIIDNES